MPLCGVDLHASDFNATVEAADTVAVIIDPDLTPDEVYGDTVVVVSPQHESTTFPREDHTHDFHWEQFAIPAGVATASALFVKTPKLVQAREWVQSKLANKTGQPRTEVDDYLQYAPMLASYAIYFCGVKGEHNLLDRTIILAMSYATFAVVNHTMKFAFSEQRPNSGRSTLSPRAIPAPPLSGPSFCAANTGTPTNGSAWPVMPAPPRWPICVSTTTATGSTTWSEALPSATCLPPSPTGSTPKSSANGPPSTARSCCAVSTRKRRLGHMPQPALARGA